MPTQLCLVSIYSQISYRIVFVNSRNIIMKVLWPSWLRRSEILGSTLAFAGPNSHSSSFIYRLFFPKFCQFSKCYNFFSQNFVNKGSLLLNLGVTNFLQGQSLTPPHPALLRKITLKLEILLSKFLFNLGRGFESQTSLVFLKPILQYKNLKKPFCHLILIKTIP